MAIQGTKEEKVEQCMRFKETMFETFHEMLPDAKFVVMSGLLLPGRSQYTELTMKVNDALAGLCARYDYMVFIDAQSMTFDGEAYGEELFVSDGIHLNRDGQRLWCESYIRPALKELIEKYDLQGRGPGAARREQLGGLR